MTMLTPEAGMISAMAHGACKIKSRFRTLSEPFGYLRVYLYHDPVKDQYKITDMESIDPFESIRKSIVKIYTASLWAEVVLKAFGGGESSGSLFRLFSSSLKALNESREGKEIMVSIQFLFRFLCLMGFSPVLETCSQCASAFKTNEPSFFSSRDLSFLCSRCARLKSIILPAGGRRYLAKTSTHSLGKALKVGLEDDSVRALKEVLYQLVQGVLEVNLNSIKSGSGIL